MGNSTGTNTKSCTCEGRAPAAVQVGTGGQGSTSEERDWGGQAGSELGMGQQCAWQQQQLTATWAVLASYAATRSRKVIIPLDLALGRPHLEYCDQFLDPPPQYRKDVDKLEQVLWRATERVEAGVLVLLGKAEGQGLAHWRRDGFREHQLAQTCRRILRRQSQPLCSSAWQKDDRQQS